MFTTWFSYQEEKKDKKAANPLTAGQDCISTFVCEKQLDIFFYIIYIVCKRWTFLKETWGTFPAVFVTTQPGVFSPDVETSPAVFLVTKTIHDIFLSVFCAWT